METVKHDPFRFQVSPVIQLNQEQKVVLTSIMDTFIPSLSPDQTDLLVKNLAGKHSTKTIEEFSKISCTSSGAVQKTIGLVNRMFLPEKRIEFAGLLSSLAASNFNSLSFAEREKEILRWKESDINQLKAAYNVFQTLACYSVYADCPVPFTKATNPEPKACANLPERLPTVLSDEIKNGVRFDAIIVGSGAGGGVVAAKLASTGKSVLVIEKGQYYHESEMVQTEREGFINMYEHGGLSSTATGSLKVLAGSVFGGGTTVNWCASLKLQDFVREEWAKQGLPHFTSPKFSSDLDKVYDRIGATTENIEHNGSNQAVIDGCKALGYPFSEIPQNTSGKLHKCSHCYAGCKGAVKNGTMNTWLRDAHDHGAKFLDKTKVNKVLIRNGKAVGVECVVHYEKTIRIMADTVVVSSGSLQSPGILLRSGLKNKNIGINLRLHPANIVYGFFDKKINTGDGSIMTAISCATEDLENDGYGSKTFGNAFHPGGFSAMLPWQGATAHKHNVLRYEYCASLPILTRDKNSKGSVEYDVDGNVIINYKLSDRDSRSISAGTLQTLDILAAAGAREIHSGQFGVEPFVFENEPSIHDPKFIAWKDRVKSYGFNSDGLPLLTAHQMGSNRMGISPSISVVKPTGETWETKDLYVADASVFPTSIGVNPMVTIEAVALYISDSIINNLKSKL